MRHEDNDDLIADPASRDPLRFIARKVRGRVQLTILLTLLMTGLGAYVGFHAVQPEYSCTGSVAIAPQLPSYLYPSHPDEVTPQYQSWMLGQEKVIGQAPLLRVALQDSNMVSTGWSSDTAGLEELKNALTIDRAKGADQIDVTINHEDPDMAAAAVNAILNTYVNAYSDPMILSVEDRIQVLETQLNEHQSELDRLRDRTMTVSDNYGRDTIAQMYEERVSELLAIDRRLEELRSNELAWQSRQTGNDTSDAMPWVQTTYRASASIASNLHRNPVADLQRREEQIVADMVTLHNRFKPGHPAIQRKKEELAEVRLEMKLRERSLAHIPAGDGSELNLVADGAMSIAHIKEMQAQYAAERDIVRAATIELGSKMQTLDEISKTEQSIRERLALTNQRLAELRMEDPANKPSRASIALAGIAPTSPERDKRTELAGAGGIFGAVLAIALICLLGVIDRRIHYVDQLEEVSEGVATIGVLPDVAGNDADSEDLAVRSVHQIRNLVELQSVDSGDRVFTITSPESGDGKTSLTLSLGRSLAEAGRRALIIDLDVVNCSLTRELGLQNRPGLCQAVGPDNAAAEIHATSTPNLWAIPVGVSSGFDPKDLSHSKLNLIVDAIRDRFDLVLIDTGPMLSSLEATLAAAVADRVVLITSAKRDGRTIQAAVNRIHRLGAECSGIVFNRAARTDLRRNDVIIREFAAAPAVMTTSSSRDVVATLGPTPSGMSRPRHRRTTTQAA